MGVKILSHKAKQEHAFDARSFFCKIKSTPVDYMHYAESLRREELILKSKEVLRSSMEGRETSNIRRILIKVLKILKDLKMCVWKKEVLHSRGGRTPFIQMRESRGSRTYSRAACPK